MPGRLSQLPGFLLVELDWCSSVLCCEATRSGPVVVGGIGADRLPSFQPCYAPSSLLHCITAPVKKFRRYASLRIKARFTRNSKSKTLGLAALANPNTSIDARKLANPTPWIAPLFYLASLATTPCRSLSLAAFASSRGRDLSVPLCGTVSSASPNYF